MAFGATHGSANHGRMWAIAIGVGIVGALVIAAAVASTAGNTVPESRAGVGEGTVTGYDISTVHYSLNASNPAAVDAVTFSVDEAPAEGSTLRIKLSSASTVWYTCTFSGTSVTCPTTTPAPTVDEVTELVVVAAQ